MARLTFRTVSQAVLFERELRGQISDGHWENSGHDYHPWCECEVAVGNPAGRDFSASYDRYNFASKDLLEVVAKRMLAYVRLALAYGREEVEQLDHLLDIDGSFAGMPTYEGAYWDTARINLTRYLERSGLTLETVKAVIESEDVYNTKALMADLREMKQTIRTVL